MNRQFRFAIFVAMTWFVLGGGWHPASAQTSAVALDLPEQTLAESLRAVATATNTNVLFDTAEISSRRAPAVKGRLTVDEALSRLLAGSGLRHRYLDEKTIVLATGEVPAGHVPTVTGEAARLPARRTGAAAKAADGAIRLAQAGPRSDAGRDDDAAPSATAAAVSDGGDAQEIVITGSRLGTRAADATAPLTIVSGDEFLGQTGRTSLGDELTELPQFRAALTQSVSGGIGVTPPSQVGLNLLDLRGLGTARTLVLQNGRRHVAGSQLVPQPDVNTIPIDLLERVEILTGGASAIYGADAIAGVVNFVLMDDYEGLNFRVQGGLSGASDADTRQLSITAGRNFADGRANIAASLAYARRELLPYSARTFSQGQAAFVPNSADTDASLPPGSPPDGIPDQILIQDLRLLFLSTGGTFFNNFLDGQPRFFRFAPNGDLNPADLGARGFFPPVPVSEGGDGYSSVFSSTLMPQNEHVLLNVIGHYDLGDRARLFGELKGMRQEARAFGQGSASGLSLSLTNAYLSDQARTVLQANLAPGATGFSIQRVNEDLGLNGENTVRETARGVVGVKGEISPRWRYEAAYSYGRVQLTSDFLNGIFPRRMMLAADAVIDSTGVLGQAGAIVCSARLAAAGAVTGDPDIDDCVPANVFGNGAIGAAARDFIGVDTRATGRLTQNLFSAFVSGDTAGLFSLPAGPMSIVAGMEYRDDSTRYDPDARDLAGVTSRAGFQPSHGSLRVSEGYVELKAPLLIGRRGAELLDVSGAVRVADYDLPGVGANTSWGMGLVYQPVQALRLRGSYQQAIRSPNIAELFQPTVATQFSVFDPCTTAALNQGSASREANCRALGIPDGFVAGTIGGLVAGTAGGNPDLNVEGARTWTVGAAFTPAQLPGFSVTVDYYKVTLRDAIATPNANTLLNQCVDSASIDNVFCPLIRRDPSTFDIINIDQRAVNQQRLTAAGLDFDVRYRFSWRQGRRAEIRTLATYVVERNDYLDPSRSDFPTQVVETVSYPRLGINVGSRLGFGPFDVTWDVRYHSPQYRRPVADFESVGGQPARNPDALPENLKKTGHYFVHDTRLGYRHGARGEFYLGVDNLFDKAPPPGIWGAGFGGANFDNIGRFFYAGFSLDMRP